MQYYANTKGHDLAKHCFAVGYLTYVQILNTTENKTLAYAGFIAGCMHDIGKIDKSFQKWLLKELNKNKNDTIPEDGQHTNFSFDKYARHNEISLLLFEILYNKNNKRINPSNIRRIKHSIFWHHAKPLRKKDITSLRDIHQMLHEDNTKFTTLLENTFSLIKDINILCENVSLPLAELFNLVDELFYEYAFDVSVPDYKEYRTLTDLEELPTNIKSNAYNNIIRLSVISCDRKISSLTSNDLDCLIETNTLHTLLSHNFESNLNLSIEQCLDRFSNMGDVNSERNRLQTQASLELSSISNPISVLVGPAGCGKTKIALEWAKNINTKQIIWVCPKVVICQNIANELKSNDYIPNSSIEIHTGEYKHIYKNGEKTDTPENAFFSGDVVITTIDQIIDIITTHHKVTPFTMFMDSNVIFDEFHEYIHMDGFNLMFAELVKCKEESKNDHAKTLLMSATPNYFFIKNILGINPEFIVKTETFNKTKYSINLIEFDEENNETNPFYKSYDNNSFVISNTATTAQIGYLYNISEEENPIVFHSKYTKQDKQKQFERVITVFGKDGLRNGTLHSGPVVQSSINVSCEHMTIEWTIVEEIHQRLGRLGRFGENEVSYFTILKPKNVNLGSKDGSPSAKFLNSMCKFKQTHSYFDYLNAKLENIEYVTISEMNAFYEDFYLKGDYDTIIAEEMLKAFNESIDFFNKINFEPITFKKKRLKKNDTIKRVKTKSLRDASRFIQCAMVNVTPTNEFQYLNEYLVDSSEQDVYLTLSYKQITGYDEDNKNLSQIMAKRHAIVYNTKRIASKELLKRAKSSENPIYVSYTPEDLSKGINVAAHNSSIYYVVNDEQPIGLMAKEKIDNFS